MDGPDRVEEGTLNAIRVIHPDKSEGVWKFDDPRHGLIGEPFVAGADVAIDRLVQGLPDADRGFTLLFSNRPSPAYPSESWRGREEYDGYWSDSPEAGLEGWLGPALFHDFESALDRLDVQVKPGDPRSASIADPSI